jgi:hypothetical protein
MVKQAFGIISLLDIDKDLNFRFLWKRITEVIGKSGLKIPIYPHFSWQVAVNYQIENVIGEMRKIAEATRCFNIQISGFGIFPGSQPVLYLSITRSPILNDIHRRIWDSCSEFGLELSPFYSSTRWIPHLTVALGQITPFDISSVVEEMAGENLEYEIGVNNLSVAYQIGNDAGVTQTFLLLSEGE